MIAWDPSGQRFPFKLWYLTPELCAGSPQTDGVPREVHPSLDFQTLPRHRSRLGRELKSCHTECVLRVTFPRGPTHGAGLQRPRGGRGTASLTGTMAASGKARRLPQGAAPSSSVTRRERRLPNRQCRSDRLALLLSEICSDPDHLIHETTASGHQERLRPLDSHSTVCLHTPRVGVDGHRAVAVLPTMHGTIQGQ